jgi:hypothetical protein
LFIPNNALIRYQKTRIHRIVPDIGCSTGLIDQQNIVTTKHLDSTLSGLETGVYGTIQDLAAGRAATQAHLQRLSDAMQAAEQAELRAEIDLFPFKNDLIESMKQTIHGGSGPGAAAGVAPGSSAPGAAAGVPNAFTGVSFPSMIPEGRLLKVPDRMLFSMGEVLTLLNGNLKMKTG